MKYIIDTISKLFESFMTVAMFAFLTLEFFIIFYLLYIFLFRRDANVKDIERERWPFVLILVVSIVLAILYIAFYP